MSENIEKHFEMVGDFHKAFSYPRQLQEISVEQLCARISYIYEEASELMSSVASGNLVGQLDAVCDLAYFTLGTLDMFGTVDVQGFGETPSAHIIDAVSLATKSLMGLENVEMPEGVSQSDRVVVTLVILYASCVDFATVVLDADFDGAFTEVQRSNMSKLGADGKPIYRDDGKILKGPSFSEPNLLPYLPAQEEAA